MIDSGLVKLNIQLENVFNCFVETVLIHLTREQSSDGSSRFTERTDIFGVAVFLCFFVPFFGSMSVSLDSTPGLRTIWRLSLLLGVQSFPTVVESSAQRLAALSVPM